MNVFYYSYLFANLLMMFLFGCMMVLKVSAEKSLRFKKNLCKINGYVIYQQMLTEKKF